MTDGELLAALQRMCNQHGVLTERGIVSASEALKTAVVEALLSRQRAIPAVMLDGSTVSSQKLSRRGYRRRQGLLYEVWSLPLPDEVPAKPKRKSRKKTSKDEV